MAQGIGFQGLSGVGIMMSQSQATIGSSCATLQDGVEHLESHKDEQQLLKEPTGPF